MTEYTVKVYDNGAKEWYLSGKLHREDGPAIEWPNGAKEWFLNGKRHREDGPAVERANGTKYWYLDDDLLTEDEWKRRMAPVKELTVKEISDLLGYEVKIIKG